MNAYEKAARHAMARMKETGAQQYSAGAAVSAKREFNVETGRFSLLRTTLDQRLDLTILKDHKRGKVLINDFTQAAIDQAVQDALSALESAEADEAWQLYPGEQQRYTLGAPKGDMDKLFERAQELLENITQQHPKVMVEQMMVTHVSQDSLYLNSLGAEYASQEGQYGASIMFSGQEDGKTGSFNYCGVTTLNLDAPFIDQGSLRQNLKDAEKQVHTVPSQGKFVGPVVFTPDCAGDILGMLLGNYVTDGVMLEGISQWKDKLNQPVADPRLNISAAPLHPDIVCGERYQGDGRLSQDYHIIQEGVLKQFMLSSFVANKLNLPPAPNGSWNLVVTPGEQSLEDLLAGIQKGLLVSRFSGGQPAPNGEFSGVAKNSFLIEDGKITQAVTETMISGNLADMLRQLRGISRETVKDGSSVIPYLAVDGITISGK